MNHSSEPPLGGRAVLIAGGRPRVVAALSQRLTGVGIQVVLGDDGRDGAGARADGERQIGRLDALILNPGESWRGRDGAWEACLSVAYRWSAITRPLFNSTGHVIACGPPIVAVPGAGYAQYVKARLALGRFLHDVAEEFNGLDVAPVALWSSGRPAASDAEARAALCAAVLTLLGRAPAAVAGRHLVDADLTCDPEHALRVRSVGGTHGA